MRDGDGGGDGEEGGEGSDQCIEVHCFFLRDYPLLVLCIIDWMKNGLGSGCHAVDCLDVRPEIIVKIDVGDCRIESKGA